MKLPSITYLLESTKASFQRFPLILLSALISVCIGVYLTEKYDDINNAFPYINLLLTGALGIPLYFCATVLTEKRKSNLSLRSVINIGATVILVLIYFSLPNSDTTHNTSLPYIRYTVFNIVIHLLVSFAPYLDTKGLNGFWNYNKVLFLRLLTALLYSGVLYVGLILALSALDLLFNIEIHDELYADFFIVIIGFFNTSFFVAGIPRDLDQLEDITSYPNALKVFVQYILFPLLVLYLLILYVYAGKILIEWDWPKGIVSYLISCVSVLGILALLLIHPYGNLPGNDWIKKFGRTYYYLLFPLVVILFMAISIRIGDYGLTINRYIIVLLGVWLTLTTVYFSIGKTNIKFVPVSLSLMLALVSFGPWGMFSLSERSQIGRLTKILEAHKILDDSKIKNGATWQKDSLPELHIDDKLANEKLLNDSLHNEVMSILDYLDDHHGFSGLRPWFDQPIDSLISIAIDSNKYVNEAQVYMNSMGLSYSYRYASSYDYYTYSADLNQALTITDYDYLLNFSHDHYPDEEDYEPYTIGEYDYKFGFRGDWNKISATNETDTLIFDLKPMLDRLKAEYDDTYEDDIGRALMSVTANADQLNGKIAFDEISIHLSQDTISYLYTTGYLLIKRKD